MVTIFKNGIKTILFFGFVSSVQAQSNIDKYIESGLKNNLVLQQKNISLDKALNSLKIANSYFFPSIDINGDYQSGEGGRSIAMPLGDMLNPVYGTLNQLTRSNSFPQIENVEAYFLPKNFYDTKLRTSIPIVNSDLIYNRSIQKQQIVLQEYDVEIYKNELIKNIKVAYYNYLSAAKSISIYESALSVAQEGKRINEKLVNNGKSVKAYILRAESEIQDLESRKVAALQQVKNAQMYFNFLINADAKQDIDTADISSFEEKIVEQYIFNDASVSKRTEIKALSQSISIYESVVKMNKAYCIPKLNMFLDLGSQNTDWKFDNKSKYYFVGFQLGIPLFAAGRNIFKIRHSELELKNQMLNNTYISKQLQLSADMAKNSLHTTYEKYRTNMKQLDAASAYYRLIEKGYKEGVNTFIETIDARNQLTTASFQMIINKYQLLAAIAIYEREINK